MSVTLMAALCCNAPLHAQVQEHVLANGMKILVKEDGSVGEVLIMDARPPDIFEDAVLVAVPRWRFEPGVVGGKKVTSWVITALHFKLN